MPGPAFAGLLALAAYGFGQVVFVGSRDSDFNQALENSTIPLWKSKQNVVNLDRAFFHLDDQNNNKLSLIHHGL